MNNMRLTAVVICASLLLAGCGQRRATDYYDRYKDRPGVKVVSFVGYSIDDSHRADVTVVQALSDSVYALLLEEFGISRTHLGLKKVVVSGPAVSSAGHPIARTIGTSVTQRSVYIFEYESSCSPAVLQYMADVAREYIKNNKKTNILQHL